MGVVLGTKNWVLLEGRGSYIAHTCALRWGFPGISRGVGQGARAQWESVCIGSSCALWLDVHLSRPASRMACGWLCASWALGLRPCDHWELPLCPAGLLE